MTEGSWLHRLEAILPGQAPLGDFVHHNTLHGLQHLPFPQALRAYRELTGISGYLPHACFRAFLRAGRITTAELVAELRATPHLDCDAQLGPITTGMVYQAALGADFSPLTAAQLTWQIEELYADCAFHPEVSAARRRILREKSPGSTESAIIGELWQACLDVLEISAWNAEAQLPESAAETDFSQPLQDFIDKLRSELFAQIGSRLTLGGLIRSLTGVDILEIYRPKLVRYLASFLDHGFGAWPLPNREEGFYRAWRKSAHYDLATHTGELRGWRDYLGTWPATADAALDRAFAHLGVSEERRAGYLQRLALELPGWSGMMLWRHLHPNYQGLDPKTVEIDDYFAVRMIMERFYARQVGVEWGIEMNLDALRAYFERRPGEFFGRWSLFNTLLPDYLATRIQQLLQSWPDAGREREWREVATLIWAERTSSGHSAHQHAWPLFLLAQHLGLSAAELRAGGNKFARELLATVTALDADTMGDIWLRAYERHYQTQIFQILASRKAPPAPVDEPLAQVIFCMDDREEGFRRHLEAINPRIETLGAAGFFGIAMNWQGLDDTHPTRQCPVGVTPTHTVCETAQPGDEPYYAQRRRGQRFLLALRNWIFQRSLRGIITPLWSVLGAAPVALGTLIGKLFVPIRTAQVAADLRRLWEIPVTTRVSFVPPNNNPPPAGFTATEQAERVGGFLRNIGLTRDFAPLVVLMGHGSQSQNNPHFAAYNCGACSGRHGGPNARVFAAMANRPQVRELLRAHGIVIPDSCWFLGAQHYTASEEISWYDLDLLPAGHRDAWERLTESLRGAQFGSAQERCRKFASAPPNPNRTQALRHVMARAVDFSQARPELGHVTNAAAIIGRRELSRGLFFDRRVYLISYDPMSDPEGKIIEGILLAAGPVGAGINLEYYFSTVNNNYFGCSSKVMHNLTGFFGVMDGANSDLRTGLPRQMIEIHEAMRLLVIVEQRPEILSAIYHRQPLLQELIGNLWIHLAASDPTTGNLFHFEPKQGWRLETCARDGSKTSGAGRLFCTAFG